MKTKIAFFIHFNKTWLGGLNVILGLINNIYSKKYILSRIKIVLITNSKKKIKNFYLNKNVEVIEKKNFFNRNIFLKFFFLIKPFAIGIFPKSKKTLHFFLSILHFIFIQFLKIFFWIECILFYHI